MKQLDKSKLEIEVINGVEWVILYRPTRLGKPHPKGGMYRFPILLSNYDPNYQSKYRTRTM